MLGSVRPEKGEDGLEGGVWWLRSVVAVGRAWGTWGGGEGMLDFSVFSTFLEINSKVDFLLLNVFCSFTVFLFFYYDKAYFNFLKRF